MSEETAVVVQDYDVTGTALESWGQRADVREAASRLMSFHQAAKEVGQPGMLAVAHLALMVGASPLPSTNEIHVWVDKHRKIRVDLGINFFRRRARELGGMLWEFEPRMMTPEEYQAEGVEPNTHIGAICRACRVSDVKMLMDVLNVPADLAFEQAMKRSGRKGVGTVSVNARAKEGRPLAWTAYKAAEKDICRALFPNLESPTPEEQRALMESLPHAEPPDHEYPGETLNGEEAENLARLREATARAEARMKNLTPEEAAEVVDANGRLLHGDPDFEGFDTPPEPPPEEEEPEPAPVRDFLEPAIIRATCRSEAGWVKGEDDNWETATRPDPPPSDPIGDELMQQVAAALSNAVRGTADQKAEGRHNIYQYLFGVNSGKALTTAEGQAILSWVGASNGDKMGAIHDLAHLEVPEVLQAYHREAGQQELPGM